MVSLTTGVFQINSQKSSKFFLLIRLILILLSLSLSQSQNTMPVSWKDLSTLIECGQLTITTLPDLSVLSYPGYSFTINFNNLINPTVRYEPVASFVDLKYDFNPANLKFVAIKPYAPISGGSSFQIQVWAADALIYLHRWTLNYLIVSQDFTDFFIYFDLQAIMPSRQINSSSSYIQTMTLSSALPSALMSNIKLIVSINSFEMKILEGSNLFKQKLNVSIVNSSSYNITVRSNLARTHVDSLWFSVIFYQQNNLTNLEMLSFSISQNYGSSQSSTSRIANSTDLVSSTGLFQTTIDKVYVTISSVAFITSIDFTLLFSSNSSIEISFSQTQQILGNILIFLSIPTPICPSDYVYQKNFNACVCNGTNCYGGLCAVDCLSCPKFSINCTLCVSNAYFLNETCYDPCPLYYFANTTTLLCQICGNSCQICSSFSLCLNCSNTTLLFNGSCVDSCPSGYYEDLNNLCIKCSIDKCYSCTSAIVCEKCFDSYFLQSTLDKCSKQCPPNYFPNKVTHNCQKIQIKGCVSSLFINNASICLQCNLSLNYVFNTSQKSCICKKGYQFKNEACMEVCGDGILNKMMCDDGNILNGDGCDSTCIVQNDFSCKSVPNGPTLTSKCTYLLDMNISIISQIKLKGQNAMKLTLNIQPAPYGLTSNQIKKFLNMQIDSQIINITNFQISYENGMAQLLIPYNQTIQGKKLNIWTNFDSSKYSSNNANISSILKGDTVSLLYSDNWHLYQGVATFGFSMVIFVCIIGVLSFYKHKMIGLQLILPIQAIFYSQSFYFTKAIQSSIFIGFKPISFSVLTPNQNDSKNNSLYIIGMTGGFLQNYNLLGVFFFASAVLLLISSIKLQNGQYNRFSHKKNIKDWVKFGQFKKVIKNYQGVIWKLFFPCLSISTIPLIFALPSKALTQKIVGNLKSQTIFDIIDGKLSFVFTVLFIFGIFYTSVPKIWYNNEKNFVKKFIFQQQCQKFEFQAKYCMYFQLHYLFIGIVFAFVEQTNLVLYVLSGVNGLFTIYVIIKRPYQQIIDNVGAILSCLIAFYYITVNLLLNIPQSYQIIQKISHFSGFIVIGLLFIQICVAFIRFFVFWKRDAVKQSQNQNSKTNVNKKFKYVRDEAFKKYTRNNDEVGKQKKQVNVQRKQEVEKKKASESKSKSKKKRKLEKQKQFQISYPYPGNKEPLINRQMHPLKIQQSNINQEGTGNRVKEYRNIKKTVPTMKN